MQTPLRGIVPPLLTPLTARDELDHAGLERLIEHVLAGGVSALFVLGTTGEGPSLSYRLRYEVVERACEIVGKRVPVLVGVTDTSLTESLDLAEFARDCGASAAVAAPPYYFPANQTDLTRWFTRLAAESALPLFLYNMPACTRWSIGPDVLAACCDSPNVIGLKDSSGDLEYFREALKLAAFRPDWTFLVGPEHLLAETVLMGGHGGVNGGANLHPRLFVDLHRAAERRDLLEVERLQQQLLAFGRIYELGGEFSSVLRGLKAGLRLLQLADDFTIEPYASFNSAETQEIACRLQAAGVDLPERIIALAKFK